MRWRMSAIGPKQTWASALHMSAFGGKADMTICDMSAFAVAIGGKADIACCAHMSAFDPKRTFGGLLPFQNAVGLAGTMFRQR